jgi:hypothetical protein
VHRGAIYIGVDHNCGNTHFAARAQDAHCNLPAIRYEDFLEHRMGKKRYEAQRTHNSSGVSSFAGFQAVFAAISAH